MSERRRSTHNVLLRAGSAGLGRRADFAASLLRQEPRSFANVPPMAATWTYLTRPTPQLSVWRGFEEENRVYYDGSHLPWRRSH